MAIPIHYDGFHLDGLYDTRPDELARFLAAAAGERYTVADVRQGDDLTF